MKREELKELLLQSITEEIAESDRQILKEKAIPEYEFSSSFSENVVNRIAGVKIGSLMRPEMFARWNNAFLRIALTGVIVIIILAVSIFLSQGSLSYDTLLGLDSSLDEGLVSLLVK